MSARAAPGYDRHMSGAPSLLVTGVLAGSPLAAQPAAASGWQAVVLMAAVAVLAAAMLRYLPFVALALLLAFPATAAVAPRHWYFALPPLLPVIAVVLAAMAICFIAATRPPPASIAAAALALGLQVISWVIQSPGSLLGSSPELAVGLITIVAWLIGHSIRQAHIHAETLHTQASAQAVTAERLRLARDLHDQVAHAIGIIAIQAGAGARVIDTQPGQARTALAAIETTSRQTLAGLRQTVKALRQDQPGSPGGTAPSGPQPGLAGLAQLAATTRHAGVRVDVHRHGEQRSLPADVDTCAFRIIQEAVTNVVRHAGTDHCRVTIGYEDQALGIEITDDGLGSAAASAGTGYGIAGMRERAALLHGELTAGPRPEIGFRVAARLPLPARQPAPAATP
jgi:signal transduction histidine kinase